MGANLLKGRREGDPTLDTADFGHPFSLCLSLSLSLSLCLGVSECERERVTYRDATYLNIASLCILLLPLTIRNNT